MRIKLEMQPYPAYCIRKMIHCSAKNTFTRSSTGCLLLLCLTAWWGTIPPCRAQPALRGNVAGFADSTWTPRVQAAEWKEGGERAAPRKPTRYHQSTVRVLPGRAGLQLTCFDSTGFAEAVTGALCLPADWQAYQTLRVRAANSSRAPLRVRVTVAGVRGLLSSESTLPPGQTGTISTDLRDLPLTAGVEAPFQPVALRIGVRVGTYPAEVHLLDVELLRAEGAGPASVADAFGQRIRGEWPEKVTHAEELRAHLRTEAAQLARHQPLPDRLPDGSRAGGGKFNATGFYRVEKATADQRWWFVTPEGNPFWSLGVTGVRPRSELLLTDVTRVKGREFLFAVLPDRTGPFAAAWQGDYLSFYYWNLLRKNGTIESWRKRLAQRLPGWGLNTLGNRSGSTVLANARMPYTRTLQTNQNPSLNVARNQPDVFDSRWETFVDSLFRRKAAPHREEKLLIGYFVDNEMPWRHLELLRAAPNAPLRRQWAQYLQTRYASALNQAWGSHFTDWAAVAALMPEALPPHKAASRDRRALRPGTPTCTSALCPVPSASTTRITCTWAAGPCACRRRKLLSARPAGTATWLQSTYIPSTRNPPPCSSGTTGAAGPS